MPHPSKPNHLLCGSTKESISLSDHSTNWNNCQNTTKTVQDVKSELHEKLCQIYPPLKFVEPIETWSGIRTFIKRNSTTNSVSNSFPIIDRHEKYPHIWLVTGYGSRGLILHQIVAKYLANAIESDSIDVIPSELRLHK